MALRFRVLAMATRRKYDAPRLEEVAGEAAVEQTKRIEAELQRDADLQKDGAFTCIKFKLDCR